MHKLAIFSAESYDILYLNKSIAAAAQNDTLSIINNYEVVYHSFSLDEDTVSLAHGCTAICVFVNDRVTAEILDTLYQTGLRAVLLRCAGYNNVDLDAADRLGIFVANVPAYSPESVAEFAVALIQTLNRRTHRAFNRTREGDFRLEGLVGRTLHDKTVGVIGLGKIGLAFARIMKGFGCKLLAFDPWVDDSFTTSGFGTLVPDLDQLLAQSDIVSLHCPLTSDTRHIINSTSLQKLKPGALLINTSRGGLVDTQALIGALKSGRLGGAALDVYEAEAAFFYKDHSAKIISDDVLMRLMTFHNVLVCGHQAFLTEEALREIADVTVRNLADFTVKRDCKNALCHGQEASKVGPVRI